MKMTAPKEEQCFLIANRSLFSQGETVLLLSTSGALLCRPNCRSHWWKATVMDKIIHPITCLFPKSFQTSQLSKVFSVTNRPIWHVRLGVKYI